MSKKKKVGRPLQSPQPRDHIIGVRLNASELSALALYCWRYDMSPAEIVRQSLEVMSVIPVNPIDQR